VFRHLLDGLKGCFTGEEYGPYIVISRLIKYLESKLQKRYKVIPSTLALLEQRCSDVSTELSRLNFKLQDTSKCISAREIFMLLLFALIWYGQGTICLCITFLSNSVENILY
jgi:hypothetical protein